MSLNEVHNTGIIIEDDLIKFCYQMAVALMLQGKLPEQYRLFLITYGLLNLAFEDVQRIRGQGSDEGQSTQLSFLPDETGQ